MSKSYLSEEVNRPRPAGYEWFGAEIERIGRQNNVKVRLVWAPEVTRFLWGGIHRLYAYKRTQKHVGWDIGKFEPFQGRLIFVPYAFKPPKAYLFETTGAHRLPNGDWVKPKFEYDDIAHPRWIIEEQLDESREKPEHERHRYEYFPDTNEYVDALGEYPKEGKWACIHVIAAHGYICCRKANEEGRFCYGTEKEPSQEDVEEVQSRIYGRNQRRRVFDHHDFETESRRIVRERMGRIKEGEQRQRNTYRDIFAEETDPWFRMQITERSKLSPVNRVAAGMKQVKIYDNYGKELPLQGER